MKKIFLAVLAAAFVVGCGDGPEDIAKIGMQAAQKGDIKTLMSYTYIDANQYINIMKDEKDFAKHSKRKFDGYGDVKSIKTHIISRDENYALVEISLELDGGANVNHEEISMIKKDDKWWLCANTESRCKQNAAYQ